MNRLIEPDAMQEWKGHPLTVEFFRFLGDRREALMQLWGRGQPLGPEWQREAALLGSLMHLKSDEIAEFYKEAEGEE